MSIHDGHRDRMRNRFKMHGLENFDDHNLFELLLFYVIPRGDTNVLAHELMNRFGSVSGVCDAPVEELMQVKGIGEKSATLIKLIPQFARRYLISKSSFDDILDSTDKAGWHLIPYFYGERDEVVYMICMDSKYKVINTKLIFRGNVNTTNISVRKIVETALVNNATRVILAHNHISGIAVPSSEDKETTQRIKSALAAVDVILVDHLVMSSDDFVSMLDSGCM